MPRALTCLLIVLGAAAPAAAQAPADQPIRLTLTPTHAPAPSLRHRLLPDPRDQVPGNAATLYYRSLATLVENRVLLQELQSDNWRNWLEMPLQELPLEEVRSQVRRMRHLLHEVELGAKRRQCDWHLEGRSEGFALLVPDVQGFRQIGYVLTVRARLEIAEGQLPQALHTIQTGLALARHLGEGPSFIHGLVGMAIARNLTDRLDELIQAPGSPNLYWSLTVLPHPLFDLGNAFREETSTVARMLSVTRELEKGALTPQQVQAVAERIHQTLTQDFALREPSTVTRLGQAALIASGHPEARKALLARGYKADLVEAMPPVQVVYLDALLANNEAWEELAKWYHVPYWQGQSGLRAAEKELGRAIRRLDLLLFNGLLGGLGGNEPLIEKSVLNALRVERRIAALRCVEALRLHAAGFGALPASLDAVGRVPIPLDPLTGKPFEYQLAEGKATLSDPPPRGVKPSAANELRYELMLRR
jgi:hypothetical protein